MPPETTVKHRRLRAHVDAYRCCVKSLVWSALVGFDVRQHARGESISKRTEFAKDDQHPPFRTIAAEPAFQAVMRRVGRGR
jgi:hypothetical protein